MLHSKARRSLELTLLTIALSFPAWAQTTSYEQMTIYKVRVSGAETITLQAGDRFIVPITGGVERADDIHVRVFMGLRADLIRYGLSGPGLCSRSFNTEIYSLSDFSGVMNFNSIIPQQWAGQGQPAYMLLVPEESTFTNRTLRIRKRDVPTYFESGVQISIAAAPSQPRPLALTLAIAAISSQHTNSFQRLEQLEAVQSSPVPTHTLVYSTATSAPAQVERCITVIEERIVKDTQTRELAQAVPCDSLNRKKRTP